MSVFIKYPKSLVYLRVKFVVILTVKTYTNRSKKKTNCILFCQPFKTFYFIKNRKVSLI